MWWGRRWWKRRRTRVEVATSVATRGRRPRRPCRASRCARRCHRRRPREPGFSRRLWLARRTACRRVAPRGASGSASRWRARSPRPSPWGASAAAGAAANAAASATASAAASAAASTHAMHNNNPPDAIHNNKPKKQSLVHRKRVSTQMQTLICNLTHTHTAWRAHTTRLGGPIPMHLGGTTARLHDTVPGCLRISRHRWVVVRVFAAIILPSLHLRVWNGLGRWWGGAHC